MILQSLFYLVGIIFFVIVIVACFIFIKKTIDASNAIKKVLTSKDVEELIAKAKKGIDNFSRAML